MSEEIKRFKSKRLTKKQLQELRKEHPETIYPLVGYHYELYNMIKEATLEGRKITVKEICERMPEYYYLNEKECNYSNCPNLYKDVDYLNHAKFSKIICKDNGGFFLANKEEALVYEEKLHNEALKAFAEYWTIHRKIEADGQGTFIDANGNSDNKPNELVKVRKEREVRFCNLTVRSEVPAEEENKELIAEWPELEGRDLSGFHIVEGNPVLLETETVLFQFSGRDVKEIIHADAFDSADLSDIVFERGLVPVQEENKEVEERAARLREGRSITVGSSHILLPSHEDGQIKKPGFRVVSELLEKVNVVNFKGGESHSVPLLTAYGTGGYTAEGGNANSAEPTFGTVTITKAKITAYGEVSEEVLKLPAANYEQAVVEAIRYALQKKIAIELVSGEGGTNKLVGFTAADSVCPAVPDASKVTISTFDEKVLDSVLYGFGGDEEVGDDGVVLFNKLTLKKLAGLRGTNEKRRLHDIDYKNKTIDGIPYVITCWTGHC